MKLTEIQEQLKEHKDQVEKAEIELKEFETYAAEELPKLDELINTKQAPVYTNDVEWNKITADIAALTTEIGEPVSKQIEAIDAKIKSKTDQMVEISKTLAQADRAKQDAARIASLEIKERELSQQIADVERQLANIDE